MEYWFYILPLSMSVYVYREILLEDGMILGWLGMLLNKIPYNFIRKPLISCHHCISGQFALWFYLSFCSYRPESIIFGSLFICSTIFITNLIYGIEKYRSK